MGTRDRDEELAATAPQRPSARPNDPLARTATAQPSTGPAGPTMEIGETLGRYRIERELGSGGMGVVYAAFDPDLERRIALKVLRGGSNTDEAPQRLLQEARAMARLAHPNVVTVHEVGTAKGRNFVAMEMVEGMSLAEWTRTERRPEAAILDAFVAAGRGLAAAHAAGIVHRDFKPHNILRSKTGRIAVTDFGLAREAGDPFAITQTLPAGSAASTSTPSTPLAGLTMTGSVLGTPAYMAPEQWAGAAVTPATDQFAYCVALWEALSGERPFRGDTVEMLRRAVELGPAPLDDSKLPRRLRSVLRRGLDPLPKQRWESMDVLLAEIAKSRRRARLPVAIGIGVVTVVVGGLVFDHLSSSPEVAPVVDSCPPPRLDASKIALDTPRPEKEVLVANLDRWQTARQRACGLGADKRPAVLACLDGVLARVSLFADGLRTLAPDLEPIDLGGYLVDSSVCELPTPPRLNVETSPQLRQVLAAVLYQQASHVPVDPDAATKLIERVKGDPCAVAWAHVQAMSSRDQSVRTLHLGEAEQSAQQCEDDRTRADIAQIAAENALSAGILGGDITSKIKLAEVAVARVAQPDLTAEIDMLRMAVAARADHLDEAISRGETAMAEYASRDRVIAQIRAGLNLLDVRELRAKPEDLAKIRDEPIAWRALVIKRFGTQHPVVREINVAIAEAEFMHGDVVDAPRKLQTLRRPLPHRKSRKVQGTVTDAAGKPVAGATVSVGRSLTGGGAYAALALSWNAAAMRVVTTSATGQFDIPDSPDDGMIVAQLGDQRSPVGEIADTVKLVLGPTSRLEGRVDLRGQPASKVTLAVEDLRLKGSRYEILSPVQPDGSFSVEVPRTKVKLYASLRTGSNASRSLATRDIEVATPVVRGIELAIANDKRVLHVIVRSTASSPVVNAQVIAFAGVVKSMTLAKLIQQHPGGGAIQFAHQLELEKAPAAVVRLARPGDAFVTIEQAPTGVASACAIGLPNLLDADLDKKARAHAEKIELRCVPVPADADVVVVDVPPWPRLE